MVSFTHLASVISIMFVYYIVYQGLKSNFTILLTTSSVEKASE